MNDDFWSTVLGNGASGPSVTPFADGFGGGGGYMSPQTGDDPVSSLLAAGVPASTIAAYFSQPDSATMTAPSGGTSAAFLPPSALAPSTPLYDPNPAQQAPTTDDLAMMYGMTPQQIAAIRDQAKDQFYLQEATEDGAIGLTDAFAPEWGALTTGVAAGRRLLAGKDLVMGGLDVLNNQAALTVPQRERAAGDQAIFKSLNDSLAQPYESPSLPGLLNRFPFP